MQPYPKHMQNRKQDIIIQLGAENVRVGLVSDRTPRKTIQSDILSKYRSDIPSHEYQIKVQEILYSIFYTHINSSSLNRTVILLEKVYTDRKILEAIVKVLFKKFKVEKVQFGLSCVMPMYLSGRFSGIVVSGGASTVQIMPVYESYPLLQIFKNMPTGTCQTQSLKDQLLILNPEIKNELLSKLTPQYLSDIKVLYSNMNMVQKKSQEIITLTLKKIKLKLKPSSLSYSNLFGNPDLEEYNISYEFLKVLGKVYEQVGVNGWEAVVGNVVMAGGMWRIKGMQTYFKKRVSELIPRFPKLESLGIRKKLRFVSWGYNPSQVSWIGASVGASVKSVDSLCLKKNQYQSEGFIQKIMQNYFLSS